MTAEPWNKKSYAKKVRRSHRSPHVFDRANEVAEQLTDQPQDRVSDQPAENLVNQPPAQTANKLQDRQPERKTTADPIAEVERFSIEFDSVLNEDVDEAIVAADSVLNEGTATETIAAEGDRSIESEQDAEEFVIAEPVEAAAEPTEEPSVEPVVVMESLSAAEFAPAEDEHAAEESAEESVLDASSAPAHTVEPAPASQPTPATAPAPEPAPAAEEPATDPASDHPQDTTDRSQGSQPAPAAKKPRSARYLKSSSLEQAFRNLLKLNGGAAWRAARCPIIVFLILFALLALAVADALPAVDALNAAVNETIHSLRGTLDSPIIMLTTIGDLLPMAGICLVICAILALRKKWDSLAFFITNVVLAVICVQALKLVFAVPRPSSETLVSLPSSFSFPSAHSFCSLVVLGMIGLLIYRALDRRGVSRKLAMIPGIILVVFAVLIGISRIYVGVHWPSDVLGGWLLAGVWLSTAGALYTVGSRLRS